MIKPLGEIADLDQKKDKEFWILCPKMGEICEHAIVEQYGYFCESTNEYMKDGKGE